MKNLDGTEVILHNKSRHQLGIDAALDNRSILYFKKLKYWTSYVWLTQHHIVGK
jgi:hypothetical protein